jgi:hypothetical protein
MSRLRVLPELAAVAALTGAAVGQVAAQGCPWMAQVNYWQQQRQSSGSRQTMMQHQSQQMQQARLQQQYFQQHQGAFQQQQHQALLQQQRQALLRQQQMQQREALVIQQRQARVVRTEPVVIRPPQPMPPALVPGGQVPPSIVRPNLVADIRVIQRRAQALRFQELQLYRKEALVLQELTAEARKQFLRLEQSFRLAKPAPQIAVTRRAQVSTRQLPQAVVRAKYTPPTTQTKKFFKVTVTCGGCHFRCTPAAPGLIAKRPNPRPPGPLGKPVPPWLTALRQPGVPALPNAVPGQPPRTPVGIPVVARPGPQLPVGVPMPALPGPQLPGAIPQPGQRGLPVALVNPNPLPLPLGPVALGGPAPYPGGSPALPQAVAPRRPARKSPGEKRPATADLLVALARPDFGPLPADPDLLQFLPVEKGGLRPSVVTVSPGPNLTEALALQSRPGPTLAVPPCPPLPETVLRLPNPPAGGSSPPDLLADGAPESGPYAGQSWPSGLPDTVLPSQPLTQPPGLAAPPL